MLIRTTKVFCISKFVSLVEYLRYPTVHLIVASLHANYKNARQIIGIFDCKDHDSG